MRCRMDYFLQSDRQEVEGFVLGKVQFSKLVPSQNARYVWPRSDFKSAIGVLQDNQMERNGMLQQPTCTGMPYTPSPKNETKFRMRVHQKKLLGHKKSLLRELWLRACLRTHGKLPPVAPTDTKASTKLKMQHTCKEGNKKGNKTRIPRHTSPNITERRCSTSCKRK